MADKPLPSNLGEMAAADYNPRTMAPRNRKALALSLWVFGDLSGIIYNAQTENLVGGHQRKDSLVPEQMAGIEWGEPYLCELGQEGDRFKSTERMGTFTTDDGSKFTVRMVDWPPAFEKAANLAANSPLLQGEWDIEKLSVIIPELQVELPTLSADLRIGDLLPGGAPLKPEGAVPAVQATPVSKLGDLWLLGRHVLCPKCGRKHYV